MSGYNATEVIDYRLCKVDKKMWDQFRRLCRYQGKSANQQLKELIQEAVDNQERRET